jgi:hypothetical protein
LQRQVGSSAPAFHDDPVLARPSSRKKRGASSQNDEQQDRGSCERHKNRSSHKACFGRISTRR